MPPDDQNPTMTTGPRPAGPTLAKPDSTSVRPWVTLEGINGVGKTYLADRAVDQLGTRCVPLVELPDHDSDGLPGQVIHALHATGDHFLQTGHPKTETLLLAALQVHRHEATRLEAGQVVLEDRGPYSVAVYQAAVLCATASLDEAFATARTILDLLTQWRPLPTATLLIVDDPRLCRERFERRTGRRASPGEVVLMERVASLYDMFAATLPGPFAFEVLDRTKLDTDACVHRIVAACERVAATPTLEAR
ncbi:hypothetical protein [Frankia sp. R82]|uniref:hypothetical protein n=1 Tax=Frankia sp. R82 TaxID=2950553 RepID=UPI00204429D1|nr:hypothetical protein [Frankia sp. R82]